VRAQFVHPLALLLWLAAGLSLATGARTLAGAVLGVIVLNAVFALAQERQAERAVEALAAYLPATGRVVRDGRVREVPAAEIVPGDVLLVSEGDRICADARLLSGVVDVDMSTLTGESVPVTRSADEHDPQASPLLASDWVFSGTTCLSGQAYVRVASTGAHTELGRVASLSARGVREHSPLEREVKRAAWVIAGVAVCVGLAFLPLGALAGLSARASFVFAVGLLVANVPEGLLPTITLALAIGVRDLARRGALVKRLSAVETLGCTTVICTDKTGTLTENAMTVARVWTPTAHEDLLAGPPTAQAREVLAIAARCTNTAGAPSEGHGDSTETALVDAFRRWPPADGTHRRDERMLEMRFDPALQRMSVVDDLDGALLLVTKGAPEVVLARCAAVRRGGRDVDLDAAQEAAVLAAVEQMAGAGLRTLAVASRQLTAGEVDADRDRLEKGLVLLAVIGLIDPPRAGAAEAVGACHQAGMRVHMVTGDHPLTATAVARRVGIGGDEGPLVVSGGELDAMTDAELDRLLAADRELVFARSKAEAKLRIADALRALGQIVAMTGDGVNDAPALRRADIGVAMGRSGTDVAREAATMVLTDDDFATITAAVEAGRRVYDNVRKFITYIFAHATPEVVPFLVFALSGGAVPLPLTVLQILAIDLGTETLPALALGREPAEPGIMRRPPRPRSQGVITRRMLARAWLLMGGVSAALVMGAFFFVLLRAGWRPGADTGPHAALHHAYLQATTATFMGIVACQVGTAVSCRTDRASLRSIGMFSNPLLLAGIGFELVFALAIVYLPLFQRVFATAGLGGVDVAVVLPFPFLVCAADGLFRRRLARRDDRANGPGDAAWPARP
jgi:calcium-translocating P-type ATPase